MYDKHYVLQLKQYTWDDKHWVTLEQKYKTYEEAEAARLKKGFPQEYRVAESYVVVRYKAVSKKEGGT